jgi:molecular chaperone DnaK
MVFQTEKQLKEFGDKLSDEKKAPIEAAWEVLKKAHASQDLAEIDRRKSKERMQVNRSILIKDRK